MALFAVMSLLMATIRLGSGKYWGQTLESRSNASLIFTLCRYEQGAAYPAHCHERPGLFFLVSGDHRETSAQGALVQPALSGLWHHRGQIHETQVGPRNMMGLNISMPDLVSAGCDTRSFEPKRNICGPEVAFAGIRLFVAIRDRLEDDEIEDRAWELLSLASGESETSPRWLSRVRDCVQGRFREPIRLRELAAQSGFHPVYVARCYRRRYGRSIARHIHELRLGFAFQLIEQGSSLGDAAYEAGFSDQAHLSRLSRRYLGCPAKSLKPV